MGLEPATSCLQGRRSTFELHQRYPRVRALYLGTHPPCTLCQELNPDYLGWFSGAEENRTPDLRYAKATLSQLSYSPIVEPDGVEPTFLACKASVLPFGRWPRLVLTERRT